MFGVTGTLFSTVRRGHNDGKVCLLSLKHSDISSELYSQPPRYGLESWDEMMMDRDKRLTGSRRGQNVSTS